MVGDQKSMAVEYRIGTWQDTKATDIEEYLVSVQRKFVKYRLNIFFLNKCALRIQHTFFRLRSEREAAV